MKMNLPALLAGIIIQFICVCSVSVAQQDPFGELFDGKREGFLVGTSVSYVNRRLSVSSTENDPGSLLTDSTSESIFFSTPSLNSLVGRVKAGYGLSNQFILFASGGFNIGSSGINISPGVGAGAMWFPSQDENYYLKASASLLGETNNSILSIAGGIGYQFHRYWTIDATVGRATVSSSLLESNFTLRITTIEISLNAWYY